jgi:hypothetical protein
MNDYHPMKRKIVVRMLDLLIYLLVMFSLFVGVKLIKVEVMKNRHVEIDV